MSLCLWFCRNPNARWQRTPEPCVFTGLQEHTVRTCSANLNLNMPVTLVCMSESRPGEGRLCFCKSPLCNGASPSGITANSLVVTLLLSLVALLLASSRCMPGCVPVAHAPSGTFVDVVSRDLVVSRRVGRRQRTDRNYVTDANAG